MRKLFSILFFTFSLFAFAQNLNVNSKNVVLDGYDPVAYFTKNKAVKGNSKFQTKYNGAFFYFSSQEDKKLFDANPIKYIPQYGAWCAYALGSTGEKVEVDPNTFKIIDGKLYLFYNKFFNNTLKSWNKDEANLKKKADANWKKIN